MILQTCRAQQIWRIPGSFNVSVAVTSFPTPMDLTNHIVTVFRYISVLNIGFAQFGGIYGRRQPNALQVTRWLDRVAAFFN